ncbi:CocE/NonD family hydrolase [Thermodesulfobacteriota bacterium]
MLQQESIKVEFNVPSKMRDGTILYADIYRPDTKDKYPAILTRLPYGKNRQIVGGYMDPQRMVRAGYVVVVQDIRGTGVSEGVFFARRAEADDGYDTVEWVAEQSWCDGNVGMYGPSHLGFTQWAAAVTQPPHLRAICPAQTEAGARPYNIGAFRLNHMIMWYMGITALSLARSNLSPEKLKSQRERLARMMANMEEQYLFLPLKDAPITKIAKEPGMIPFYSEYLAQIENEDYWKKLWSPAPIEKVVIPAFHLCGWYDLLASDVLESFQGMKMRGGSELARNNQKLVMGPWIHGAALLSSAGELDFGTGSTGAAIDMAGMHIRWFDRFLKGIDNGVMDEPPVKLFIMGDNIWRDENEWPLARTRYTRYYFHSGGRANSRFGDGALSTEIPEREETDIYLYDPRNPTPTKTGTLSSIIMGAFDQQEVEERTDVLVYTSPLLETDLEVTGPIEIKLWAASSAVDTDFTGKLVDVWPNGKAYNLVDGIVRARYRESESAAKLIKPKKVYEYSINLGATSNVFKAGHRIRVEISSSSFPKWDRNLNTGNPVGQDAEMKVAVQTIFHDRKYPSHIVLPVIPDKSG